MGDHLELWSERTPEPVGDLHPLPVQDAGAGQAELVPALAPADDVEAPPERGPFVTYLCLPWSYGRNTGERWHRMRCRVGRHEMAGGELMQVGGAEIFVERRCRWCEACPTG
jgi:hypothetical protein